MEGLYRFTEREDKGSFHFCFALEGVRRLWWGTIAVAAAEMQKASQSVGKKPKQRCFASCLSSHG